MLISPDSVGKFVHYNALVAWRTRDFWVRAALCWVVGAVLLFSDESTNFDMRLRIRGPRPSTAPIVLIDLSEQDWSNLDPESRNVLRPLKELVSFTDSYFWSPRIWSKLLTRVLADNPSAVGVTFYFGEGLRSPRISDAGESASGPRADVARTDVFRDPRVIWSGDIDNAGRLLLPLFAAADNTNIATRGLRSDNDGTIRRFTLTSARVMPLPLKLAQMARGSTFSRADLEGLSAALINYVGDSSSFRVISAKDIIDGRVPAGILKNQIVLIGNLSGVSDEFQTPLGRMSRTEIMANMTEDVIEGTIVHRLPNAVYLILLAMMIAGSIWLLLNYPQSVTLVILVLTGMVWTALSVFAFDVGYIWLPVFSPLAQLTITCIVYLSYQLAVNERRTWRLEEEQRYLTEIEQLKTNFVSMMSHDLKTPIAKIQAICDRLISSPDSDLRLIGDLKSLRRSSDELHRYIQSILQISKVEAKDFRIQMEVTDLNENIERVVQRLRPLAAEKGIGIETVLEPLFSIEVDSALIQEVIHNLIENAIKYMPGPGNKTPQQSEPSRVRVSSQEKDDKIIVVVEDTGPGIDLEDQKVIWLKFTRGRNQVSGKSEVRGTGLGLYLVKYFVELHGGTVFLESEPGRGTRIGFSIPVQSVAT